MHFVIYWY